jgi:hypothetical protein
MSIQKKSLISTLKAAKKANVTKNEVSFDHSAKGSLKASPSKVSPSRVALARKARPAY